MLKVKDPVEIGPILSPFILTPLLCLQFISDFVYCYLYWFFFNICTVIMYWFLSTVTVLYVLFWIALSIKYRLFKKKKKS